MAFRPRNTNIHQPPVPESDSWDPAYEPGKKQRQPIRFASTAADKENVPPLQSSFGGNVTNFTYRSTSIDLPSENTANLAWQSVLSKSISDPPIFASQERSSLPTLFTQKLPPKQSSFPISDTLGGSNLSVLGHPAVPTQITGSATQGALLTHKLPPKQSLPLFSDSLQGSNLSILGHPAVPTRITGVATQGEKPVSFAHAVRANLPPPPPKLPVQSYYYGSNVETENLVYSQFPEKIQTPADFGRAIRDAAKTGNPIDGAKLSERMLRKMIDDFEHKRSKYRPDGACFNAVIHAYAEMGDAHAAEHILTLMHQDFEKGNANAEPNAKIYTNILHAWRKSKSPDGPERCEKILGTMNRLSDTGALPNCKPDAFSYTVAFHCWAESNRHEAAERADRLFREMESRYMAGESGLQPDAILYSNVINIFTKNATTNNRAEELLWAMVHDFLTGNNFAEPKIRNFNTIMAMWSKSTEDIAPYKAQTIVLRMLEFCKERILNIAPDPYTYCLLLKTWASSKHPEGVSQALKCLYWMKEQFNEGDEAACPDVIKYTTCISALAKNGNPDRAESLLREMCEDYLGGNQKAKPNSKLFEIVLNSWTGSYKNDADPHRAEALLRHMWDLHSSQKFRSIRPRSVTYSRIVMSMASNNDPERAEELLFEMDQLCHSQKIGEGPTLELLLAVTKSWIRSKHEDRHLHIQLLHKLRIERFANI